MWGGRGSALPVIRVQLHDLWAQFPVGQACGAHPAALLQNLRGIVIFVDLPSDQSSVLVSNALMVWHRQLEQYAAQSRNYQTPPIRSEATTFS